MNWPSIFSTLVPRSLIRRGAGPALLLCLLGVCPGGSAQTGKLVFGGPVEMLTCYPVSSVPCFRLALRVVNADGTALSLPLPLPPRLASMLTVHANDQDLTPFYASAANTSSAASQPRFVLILIDISGSMLKHLPTGETRFDAAKAAASHFLEGFEAGTDHVAVVPFESHQVKATIQKANFATSLAEAEQQVNALPPPRPRNNTALYSAVDEGLELLERQLATSPEAQAQLYVLTDGENEVYPQKGDDPGLLGSDGLQEVIDKIRAYTKIEVIAVGFGDAREVDTESLQQMSNRFKMVTDVDSLKRLFQHPARQPVSSEIVAGFQSPWPDRASMAAQTLSLRVSLKGPNGELQSDETGWSSPELGVPVYEGRCNSQESDALINYTKLAGSFSVLRPILVLLGLAGLLLILRFWVPRLVWADEYLGRIPAAPQGRWSAATASVPVAGAARRPPPGFDSRGLAAPPAPRAPVDATRVLPANWTTTRIRLEQKKAPEDR